jgi:hypothetical protein
MGCHLVLEKAKAEKKALAQKEKKALEGKKEKSKKKAGNKLSSSGNRINNRSPDHSASRSGCYNVVLQSRYG